MADTSTGGLDTWQSGWFWIDGYAPGAGYARMSVGLVGEVIVTITSQVWDGTADLFHLRYDSARHSVDLLAKMDLDTPWSWESTYRIPAKLEDDFNAALEDLDSNPGALFGLVVTVNPDLAIRTMGDDEFTEVNCATRNDHSPTRWTPSW